MFSGFYRLDLCVFQDFTAGIFCCPDVKVQAWPKRISQNVLVKTVFSQGCMSVFCTRLICVFEAGYQVGLVQPRRAAGGLALYDRYFLKKLWFLVKK